MASPYKDDTHSHILLKDSFLDIPGPNTLQFNAPTIKSEME